MRKHVVLVGLVCTALSGLLFLSAPASRPEDSRRLASWSRQVLALSDNPFVRPWIDSSIEDLRVSGLWEYYKARFDGDVGDRADAAARKSFTLTFPHTVNGQGNGLSVKTTIVLVNNSETNANGSVYLRKTDGTAMSVRTNLGSGSVFDFSMLPGEVYRLETDGTGALQVGWVEVISDIQLAGSGMFALSSSAGQFLSEVGIADSPRARSLMIFVDTTNGKNAGYATANPGTAAATLRLQLKRLDGTVAATRDNVPLGALNQKAEFVTETFAGTDLRNFRGVLLITSNADIAVATLRTRDVRFTSLPSAPEVIDTSKQGTYYLARVGDGIFGGLKFQTSALLINNSARRATATVDLFRSDGSAMTVVIGGARNSRFTVEVPAGGAVELLSDGSTNPGATGWARVTSDIPLSVAGAFSIASSATGEFVSEVGVPSSSDSTRLSLFAQVSQDVDTGLGLTNIDATSKQVLLRLVGASPSSVFAEKTINLDARGHTGRFVSELFPEVPEVAQRNFVGRLEAEAFGITALTLRSRGALLTSLPVAGLNRAAFAPKLAVSVATSLEGSSPALCFRFTQNSGEALTRQAIVRLDKGSVDFSRITQDTQIIGNSTLTVLGLLFSGRCFATDISSSSTQFYCVPSLDGQSETVPFIGFLSNNTTGSGILLGMDMNPGQYSTQATLTTSSLCFDPGLFRLPQGAATGITVSQEYESVEQTVTEGDVLKRTATSSLTTSTIAAAAPRVDSVTPTSVAAGTEVLVSGSNFASSTAANTVTVQGDGRLAAAVTEAGSRLLKLVVPENTVSGPLRVQVGGNASNDYNLDVVFSPQTTLAFGSLSGGGQTTLRMTLTQAAGQIAFMDWTITPSSGGWRTAGFTAGAVVGTLKIANTIYDLKVKTSAADKLTLEAIEQGKTTVTYRLEAGSANGSPLILTPAEFPDTVELAGSLSVELNFTQAVFRMPAGAGVGFDLNQEIVSMPERNRVRETAFRVRQKRSFTTN